MEKVIAIIDLKSFYASCECSARHLDPFSTPLVCADANRGPNTIIMSATPYLKKKYGVPNVSRVKDLPKIKGLIYATPRMAFYLQMSARVVSIFLDYVAKEDLHVYSIDESFLNLGPYLSLYSRTPEEIVTEIQARIYKELGLIATAGIGPNMFLAKLALDNEGKKEPPFLARWTYQDVPTKLWNITPITKIWSINTGTASHLSRIGINSIKSLARAPLEMLKSEFGVMGEQLHCLANGIDDSDIQEAYVPKERNLSLGQTLWKDYSKKEASLLVLEMCDDLTRRLRKSGMMARKVSLFVGYKNGGGAYSKERSLPFPTDDNEELFESLIDLYENGVSELPIRGLSISFGSLVYSDYEQTSLFFATERRQENKKLNASLDAIKEMYGKNSVLRCSSLLKESTTRIRHEQIGGHKE